MGILEDLLSKNVNRVAEGVRAICHLHDRDKLIAVASRLLDIKGNTKDMTGVRHLDFALRKLRFSLRNTNECLCVLHPHHQYDPEEEQECGQINILEKTLLDNAWPAFYVCECTRCGKRYRVEAHGGGHYNSLAWKWCE